MAAATKYLLDGWVIGVKYRYARKRFYALLWLGKNMPARLRYATVLSASCEATTGKYSSRHPGDVSIMDLLKETPGGDL